MVGAAYGEFAKIPEALLLAFNAPAIEGVGASGGFSVQLQDPSGGDFKKFAAVAQQFVERAQKEPAIGRVGTNFRVSSPRLYADVNRERAKALGIPISEIFDTLQAYFGNFYINDFVKFGRVYHVQTEAEAEYPGNSSGYFEDLCAGSERPGHQYDSPRYRRDGGVSERTGSGESL